MHETGHSGLVYWDNPEGRNGEEDGRGVWDQGTHVHRDLFTSMYGKNHHNIIK